MQVVHRVDVALDDLDLVEEDIAVLGNDGAAGCGDAGRVWLLSEGSQAGGKDAGENGAGESGDGKGTDRFTAVHALS